MRIGVDLFARYIFKTGVRIVIDNLLDQWQKIPSRHEFILLEPSRKIFQNPQKKTQKAWNHLYRFYWSQIESQLQAKHHKCDIVFATCMFSPYIQLIPTVTLIFDMALWRHPEWYPRWWLTANRIFTQYPARFVRHIVTISEHARQDIIREFHLPDERVSAIYLGIDLPNVDPKDDQQILRQYGIPQQARYILYMGPIIPHKNLPRLVAAFGLLVQHLPDQPLFLVIGGPATNSHGHSDYQAVQKVAQESGVTDRLIFTGFVPREHCTVLYRNAYIYAFPSLFEGFGLPLVEAMASGVPIVAANCSALPEMGGDAAYYFNPLDIQDIAKALYTVATQDELRHTMIQRGLERAKIFSWQQTATKYIEIFEAISKV